MQHARLERMMKKFLLAIGITTFLSFSTSFGQPVSADLILLNGKVFIADLGNSSAEAVAIRGDRIVAVGSSDEVKQLANAKTRVIDLQGRTVIPGINDAHFHFSPRPASARLQFTSLEPSWSEVVSAIENIIKEAPKGNWILGTIGGTAMAKSKATRFALDQIAPDHPVLLETYYGHGQIINSRAMASLRISETQPAVLGGHFERDPQTKRINGRIFRYAQWQLSRALTDMVTDEDAVQELKKMSSEAVAFGITSIQIMPLMRVDRFVRLLEIADLPIRVRAIPFSLTSAKERDLSEVRQLSRLKSSNPRITASGIKWILDGTPFERGAALRQPYTDDPSARGQMSFPESEVTQILRESLSFRQPMLLHAVGDRAVASVLTAMEKMKGVDWRAQRVRIEHGDGLTPDLIARAEKLGIVVVQNPTHLALRELFDARFSPDRNFVPVRSLLEARIPFALGSDGPMNPFLNIMLASIHPVRPTESITREEAVRAYTTGAAYGEFAEDQKGSLMKGKLADLTVLSQDIFSVPVPELPKTQSVLTIIGGKIVYDAAVLK